MKDWTLIHILFFLTYLISGLIINCVQFSLWLILPSETFKRLNRSLMWTLYSQLLFLAEYWTDSQVRLHIDKNSRDFVSKVGSEHALVILNHHYETDWMFGWMIAQRFGVLGNARVFLKTVLKYVPIIGWAWNISDAIFLQRDWNKDQKTIENGVRTLIHYPDPMWLLIFAEGTRFTAEKYEACRKFRSSRPESHLPDLKHHLIPRSKGFVLTLRSCLKYPDKIEAVYDATVVANLSGAPATMSSLLTGKDIQADMFVRRIRIKDIDTSSEESITKFLMDTYVEKDILKQSFLENGTFSNDKMKITSVNIDEENKPKKSSSVLINMLFWNAVIQVPLLNFLVKVVLSGNVYYISLIASVFLALYVGLNRMLNVTKVSKSSDYGSSANKSK